MFRSVLVPLDGASFSERALSMAREVARASGATVHLARVHVRKEPNALLGGASLQWQRVDLYEYDPKERRSEVEYLHAVEERLSSSGVAAGSELLENRDLTDQLCEYARRVDADAVFMSSHARGGLDRMIRGSVAERVIRDSQFPVFIVHPTDGERDVYVSPDINHVLVADSRGADLIVMATHGFKGVRRTLAGSVSEGVLQASPLPIMIMRPIHRGLNNESDE